MADNLDTNLYLDNANVVGCKPTVDRFHPTTGVWEEGVEGLFTGRTDGHVFLSLSKLTDGTAEPIHATLDLPLVEIETTEQFQAEFSGALKTLRLASTPDKTKVYAHFQFDDEPSYHRSIQLTLHHRRADD